MKKWPQNKRKFSKKTLIENYIFVNELFDTFGAEGAAKNF